MWFQSDVFHLDCHTYHLKIFQSSGKQTGNGPNDYTHKIEVNSDTPGATSVSNREFESRLQDEKRQIKLLDPRFLSQFLREFSLLIGK